MSFGPSVDRLVQRKVGGGKGENSSIHSLKDCFNRIPLLWPWENLGIIVPQTFSASNIAPKSKAHILYLLAILFEAFLPENPVPSVLQFSVLCGKSQGIMWKMFNFDLHKMLGHEMEVLLWEPLSFRCPVL